MDKKSFELEKFPHGSEEAEAATEGGDRETWANSAEFILSCLGYAVGFGNVWRFPFLLFKNGGAAFLIPYFLMLVCAGFPLFFMELALGQYASLGPTILFAKMAPILTGVGYSMLMISLLITIYYNLIFAWTLFYTFASFVPRLPWGSCEHSFNSPNCYTEDDSRKCTEEGLVYYNKSCIPAQIFCQLSKLHSFNSTHCIIKDANLSSSVVPLESTYERISSSEDYYRNRMLRLEGRSWEDMGAMRWEIVGCLALAWIIIYLCMIKGVRSSGKVVYFTATFPYVVLLVLLIRGLTLPGAYMGIEFYIMKPNMTRLLEIEVWNDAASQIFYSLGASAGVLITLSSYNPFKNNCLRDAMFVAICNSGTSIFAGFVIFSVMGFMASELGVEVKDVVESGSGLAFIAYPEAVNKMPISPLWAILFFFMLITLGIDSQFSYIETLVTAIIDSFEYLRPKKPLITALVILGLFLSGLTMCLEGGVYMFELFVWYSSGISLISIGFIEVVVIQYIYGFRRFMRNITEEMGIKIPAVMYCYLTVTWLFITPASLLLILSLSIYFYVPAYYGSYVFPANIQTLGWIMCASSVALIPIGAIWVVCRSGKSCRELFDSSELCPAHVRLQRQREREQKAVFKYTYDNVGYQNDVPKKTDGC